MTRCPSICERSIVAKKKTEKRRKVEKRIKTIGKSEKNEQKVSIEEKFNNEVKLDREKVRKMVPQRFHKQLKIYEKAELKRIPVKKPWDHTINIKEDFIPRKGKTYLMSRKEKEKIKEFVEEQLRKEYVRLSKSPQTSLVFFVEKKNRKKKIIQNYQYLNKETIKNNYPLPLISDLINTMGTKKVLTKMDLRQGYNNIQIKKGNKWKAIFTTYLEVYKPIVMFFGLTNSPTTFQAIINNILRDLIDTGNVIVFIDNMLVRIENEKKHNEIVEEVLRRMEENDLYIKPEKCVWKVKEINFLGLVMGAKGIKMQKKKVARVLKQPRSKMVKEV